MSQDFGDDVSRILPADDRQFTQVVWQEQKPPLDSELNLVSQIQEEARENLLSSDVPSGWLGDPYGDKDNYSFDQRASNLFWFGGDPDNQKAVQWAHVNGWAVPVVGTNSPDLRNQIQLPPPQSGSETDVAFVFLEVWRALVQPGTSDNKPAQDKFYRYGNVKYGGTNPDEDMIDPDFQFETSIRVQLQYRLRTATDVDPAAYPNGFNPQIKAQGTRTNPVTNPDDAYEFSNMADELGDPGLWRAGTGDPDSSEVETVDGYTYAVPVCFAFRRTTGGWSVVDQHSAYNRYDDASDVSDARVLPEVNLTSDVAHTDTTLEVDTGQTQTEFPSAPATNSGDDLIRIGDEVIRYSDYTGTTMTVAERGARNTHATNHSTDDEVRFVSDHPDGVFSDQIVADDILDLRQHVAFGDRDYQSILDQNFNSLLTGDLDTNWKRSEGNVLGPKTYQADFISGSAPPPNGTLQNDRPDGFRRVFSDAAALQPDNLLVADADTGSASTSEYGFNPDVVDIYRASGSGNSVWRQNDVFEISLDQFRTTFQGGTTDHKVRFVHPFEYDDAAHDPVKMWVDRGGNLASNTRTAIEASEFDPYVTGSHDGSSDNTNLVDTTTVFTDQLIGLPVRNTTDGSTGEISGRVGRHELEVSNLRGGDENDFDSGDSYEIGTDGDEPWFVVLGTSPEGSFPVSLEGDATDIDFDVGGSPNGISISGIDFSQTKDGVAVGDYLAQIPAWIVLKQDEPNNPSNHGAFRILGEFNGGDLLLQRAKGDLPSFTSTTNATRDWNIATQATHEDDDELHVALHNASAGNPYSDPAENARIGLTFDMLYHPAQGLGRQPLEPYYVQMETTSASKFLREDDFANFADSSTATVKKFPSRPLAAFPHRRDAFSIRDQKDPDDNRETVWAESYVDEGSRTLLFQPWQETDLKVSPTQLGSTASYEVSNGQDATGRFNLDAGDFVYKLPREVFPPTGRMDLPFVQEQTSAPTDPAYGLNFLFRSSESAADKLVRGITDGPLFMVYDPSQFTDSDWGDYVDLGNYGGPGGVDALVTRPYEVQGRRIGIEVPPHYGIARLFGIYEFSAFDSQGGASGFDSAQRIDQGTYTNLLREDAERRSLYVTPDNTFVIPDDAIDLSFLPNKLGGDACQNQNGDPLIFEAGLFMFDDVTSDFVGVHATDANPSAADADIPLYVNGPADTTETAYQVSSRRPYQGDITHTMPASGSNPGSLSPEDYAYKHGAETPGEVGSAFQEDLNLHDLRDPNAASLNVVASRTFATTLGAGTIAGPTLSGAYTDTGYLSFENYPYTSPSADTRSVQPRSNPVNPRPDGDGQPILSDISAEAVGLTEQLPMGILYGDYSLLGEPLFEDHRRFWDPDLKPGGYDTFSRDDTQTGSPLSGKVVFSDGTALGGSGRGGFDASLNMYRTYRGGVIRLEGDKSDVSLRGGTARKDFDHLSEVSDHDRTLHGGVLVGAALLVQDSAQTVTTNDFEFSAGGELQMVVLTGVVQGNEALNSLNHDYEIVDLLLKMHTRGLGEGRAAADRYRVEGRPLDITTPETTPPLTDLLDE